MSCTWTREQLLPAGVCSDSFVPRLSWLLNIFTIASVYYVADRFCLVGRMPEGQIVRWVPCVTSGHVGTGLGAPLDPCTPGATAQTVLGSTSTHVDVVVVTVPVTVLAATEGELAARGRPTGGPQSGDREQTSGVPHRRSPGFLK